MQEQPFFSLDVFVPTQQKPPTNGVARCSEIPNHGLAQLTMEYSL
jgi:hypothetical protein